MTEGREESFGVEFQGGWGGKVCEAAGILI